jgi:hypothetical protein
LEGLVFIGTFDTDAALKSIEKNKKMRRTGQNPRRTGQRGGNGGENENGFLDRMTGFAGGLEEWTGYEYGLRRHGGSASSPDPFFSHGQRGNRFQAALRGIDHAAFEEGLDRIYRIFRIIGTG